MADADAAARGCACREQTKVAQAANSKVSKGRVARAQGESGAIAAPFAHHGRLPAARLCVQRNQTLLILSDMRIMLRNRTLMPNVPDARTIAYVPGSAAQAMQRDRTVGKRSRCAVVFCAFSREWRAAQRCRKSAFARSADRSPRWWLMFARSSKAAAVRSVQRVHAKRDTAAIKSSFACTFAFRPEQRTSAPPVPRYRNAMRAARRVPCPHFVEC